MELAATDKVVDYLVALIPNQRQVPGRVWQVAWTTA
jgi:hypothetical protein